MRVNETVQQKNLKVLNYWNEKYLSMAMDLVLKCNDNMDFKNCGK